MNDPAHAERVRVIAERMKALAAAGEPLHIDKGGVHHFVPLPGDRRFHGRAVDISSLRNIVSIDPAARTCVAEPGVTFAELVQATLQHGLVPAVVPELEGITVGGAIAGCSVESMSYRYGGFHDTCLEYEIVDTDGGVLTCSPEREPLLFHMIHGSYGTLGVLTLARFKLVPAEPFVEMTYRKFDSIGGFVAEMNARMAAADYDFIDGIIFSPSEHVLCLGKFAKTAESPSDYRWLEIYYKSVRGRSADVLTTPDYFFRYDTECHWLTRTIPPLEWKPVRFAVGKIFLGSTNLIRWSKRLDPVMGMKKRPDVVVDVFIPGLRFEEFLKWYESEYKYYPLWIVPYKVPAPYAWVSDTHAAGFGSNLFIDCAVYGKSNSEPDVDWSEVLERKTYELGGIKTLISRNHHSRDEFWKIYDRGRYDAAKARLDPKGRLPGLYEKFHRG